MKKELFLPIKIEVIELSGGTTDSEATTKELGVPEESTIKVTLFRGDSGFIGVVTSKKRRVNYASLFRKLEWVWSSEPTKDELDLLGKINLRNPFELAEHRKVKIIIDALLVHQEKIIIPIYERFVIKTNLTEFIIGTSATVISEISLPL